MTREEELYETADNFSEDHKYEEDLDYVSLKMAFIEGAEWADNHPVNVWHDATEEPKFGEDIIALCDDVPVAGVFTKHLFGKGIFRHHCLMCEWYAPVHWESVDKWAYIKDILPKGGEK